VVTIFETDRLLVRDFAEDDIDAAWAVYGDPEVSRWLGGVLVHDTVEQTRDLLRRIGGWDLPDGLGLWAVVEKATGQLIGGAELLQATIGGQERVEIGYHFRRDSWGRGYATELAAALLRQGFERAGLQRIVGVHLPGNEASARVLRKIGMREQGMVDYNGTPVHLFALDRQEWDHLRPPLQ
jgi:RimJ/RimL family protein N-acetyltransferase